MTHTRIPIHQLIRQLPIPLHRLQSLPLLPLQRIRAPTLFPGAKRPRQARPHRLLPRQHPLVIRLQQDPHRVHHRLRPVQHARVPARFQHIRFPPRHAARPGRSLRRRCHARPDWLSGSTDGCHVPAAPYGCFADPGACVVGRWRVR